MGEGLDKSPDENDKATEAKTGATTGEPTAAAAAGSTPPEQDSTATPPAENAAAAPPVADAEAAPPVVEAKKDAISDDLPDDLPVVESPKLDGSESIEETEPAERAESVEPERDEADFAPADFDEGISPSDVEAGDSTIPEVAAEMPAAAPAGAAEPKPRSSRFALLAAVIALAAAVGALLGALTGAGIMRLMPSEPAAATSNAEAHDMVRAMREQLAELSSIKASLDGATRNTNAQFAKLSDRLDKVERAQSDPSGKLAHIADAVDRLDKRVATAGPETTGSIGSADGATEAKTTDRIIEGWVVQEVQGNRALIENRNGGIFEVGAGSVLPGIGRVESVKRQDGQWIVVTARGLILSAR